MSKLSPSASHFLVPVYRSENMQNRPKVAKARPQRSAPRKMKTAVSQSIKVSLTIVAREVVDDR